MLKFGHGAETLSTIARETREATVDLEIPEYDHVSSPSLVESLDQVL